MTASFRGSGVLGVSALLRAGSSALLAVVLATAFGPEWWGLIAASTVVLNLATQLFAAGVYPLAHHDLARGHDACFDLTTLRRGSVLAGLATGGCAVLLDQSAGYAVASGVAAAAALAGTTIVNATRACYLHDRRFLLAGTATSLRSLMLLLVAAALVALGAEVSPAVWWLFVGAAFLVEVGTHRFLLSDPTHRPSARREAATGRLMTLGAGSALIAALRTGDQLLLGLLTDLGSVGTYALAARAIDAAVVLIAALVQTQHSSLAHLAAKGERVPRHVVQQLMTAAAVLTVGISGVVALAAPRFLREYEELALTVALLSISVVPRTLFLVYDYYASLSPEPRHRLRRLATAAIANVLLNLLLIPIAGITGAVLATLTCEIGLAVSMRRAASRPIAVAPPEGARE